MKFTSGSYVTNQRRFAWLPVSGFTSDGLRVTIWLEHYRVTDLDCAAHRVDTEDGDSFVVNTGH